MKMKRKMKVFALLMTALTLSMSSVSFGFGFTDIDQAPWEEAKDYINKAADLELVRGSNDPETGELVFKPNDNVTYNEATQIAYNLLNKYGLLEETDNLINTWKEPLTEYNIPLWAFYAVGYYLETGLLSPDDVSYFMNNNGDDNYANRENVAIIFGKTLELLYSIDKNATLDFADTGDIYHTSIPYISLLKDNGIISGTDQNEFNPKNNITRTEMAIMAVRADAVFAEYIENEGDRLEAERLEEERLEAERLEAERLEAERLEEEANKVTFVRGTVIGLEATSDINSMITLTTGEKTVGFVGNNYMRTINETGTDTIDFGTLQKGDVITIVYDGITIESITVHYATKREVYSEDSGLIVNLASSFILLENSDGVDTRYSLGSTLEVTVDGMTANINNLLYEFDLVNVDVVVTVNDTGVVTKIVATTDRKTGIEGELISIGDDYMSVRLRSGIRATYDFDSSIDIDLEGRSSDWEDIDEELDYEDLYVVFFLDTRDEVTYLDASEDASYVTSGSAASSGSSDVDGYVDALSSSRITIKSSKSSSSTNRYYFASDVEFYLNNIEVDYSDFADIFDDYDDDLEVDLYLDSDDDVLEVRGFYSPYGSVRDISRYDIEIRNSNGSYEEYDLSDDVEYIYDGDEVSRSYFEDLVEDLTIYVTLKIDTYGEVVEIDADYAGYSSSSTNEIEGVLVTFSTSYARITNNDTNSQERYYFNSYVEYYLNGSSSTNSSIDNAFEYDYLDVIITLNSSDQIIMFEAFSDGVVAGETLSGYLKTITSNSMYLEVTGVSQYKNVNLNTYTTFMLDNKQSSVAEIASKMASGTILYIEVVVSSTGYASEVVLWTAG